jgi:glycosyltransferase involved in cell wall biosynthesis
VAFGALWRGRRVVLDRAGGPTHDSSVTLLTKASSLECDMRVAYFTNQYPATPHTFIRREIRAMEALGLTVFRYALRSSPQLVDGEDRLEAKRTRYILKAGPGELLRCFLTTLFKQPAAAIGTLRHAARMGWRSDRGLLRHLAYAAEAVVLADWCRRDAIAHLHTHFGTNPAAVAMLAHELSGIPYSFTAHGSEEFEKAPLLSLDAKLEHAAFAVCVSSFGRSQLMRWSPPEQWSKIAVVRCGVDSGFLEVPVEAPSPTPRFVCVGRLGEHKAQLVLVGAARRLREAGLSCEIVLAGDGPMRPRVEAAIRQFGLEGQISITGWVSGERVKAEILAARALVLPSFSENMPVVIMEAMALGRPVISTYIAGIPELVVHGQTGWLVPSSDEAALAEAMREALTASVGQLAAMGAAGRARIVENHDVLKEAKKLKSLFETADEKDNPVGCSRGYPRQDGSRRGRRGSAIWQRHIASS